MSAADACREKAGSVSLEELDLSLGRVRCPLPARIEAMSRDLHVHGQLTPVVAFRSEPGTLQLLDGFKRERAARSLGWSRLEVSEISAPSHGPWTLMLSLNRSSAMTVVEEALLLAEMSRSGLRQSEIAEVVGRHKSWVSRRIGLVTSLAPELVEDLKLGLLHAGVARRLLVLPRGNQVELAAVVRAHGLGVRDTEELVSLCRHAPDDETRRWVLEHPRAALAASRGEGKESQTDPRLSSAGQRFQRTMRLAQGAVSRLCQLLPPRLEQTDRPLLSQDVGRLRARSEEMTSLLGPTSSWPSAASPDASEETD